MRKANIILFIILLEFMAVTTCFSAGHWALAFWRCLGKNENANNLFIRVWTFDENGNMKGNIPITTPTGTVLGTTGPDGRVDITMSVSTEYQCKVGQAGTTSDITPYMSNGRYPNWGHYSYELGFMYKSDINNPGTFDTSIVGGPVPRWGGTSYNAPCTASLAYYCFNPYVWDSDDPAGYALPSNGWGEHGQTFVANGNRVICAQFHPTVSGVNNPITFTVEIREGGPNGRVIASKTSGVHYNQDWWIVPFGVNECPVVPGQTYFARVYRPENFNAYYSVNNLYANGQGYSRPNSTAEWSPSTYPDLKGFIVCGNSAPMVEISNVQVTPSTGSVIITWNTSVPATSRIDYGLTNSYGKYVYDSALTTNHTMVISKLRGDTMYHYKITSSAPNYVDGVTADATFVTQSANPNLLVNGGFETGQIAPWVKFGSFSNNRRSDGIGPWCTGKCPPEGYYDIVSITSYGTQNGGFYQQVSNVIPGATYTARMMHYTWQQGGVDSDCANVLMIDPYGGTNPDSANLVKTPELSSQDTWTTATLSATAASSTITVFVKAIQKWPIEWNTNGFDDIRLTGPVAGSIPTLKGLVDGAQVMVSGKVVTAIPSQVGAYYIEEVQRQSAIRVEAISGSANVGQMVKVAGWIGTNENGERVIIDATITPMTNYPIEPLSMTNRELGGSDWNDKTKGATNKTGLNNVGLLVQTWGRVTSKSGTDFYITDGSGDPVRVDASALGSMPEVNDYVIVTGICRLKKIGANYIPYIQLRQAGDWVKKN
jgi:hypothetical protein